MNTTLKHLFTLALAFLIAGTAGEAFAAKKRSTKQVSGVLNLNTASAQQLDMLPGVGAKAAQRIIDHRKKTPFARAEELVKVKGFGKKKFEKLKNHLSVSGPTTIQELKAAPSPDKEGAEAQGRKPTGKR